MPGKSAGAVPTLSADELAKALDVKPPADPQVLEDHVHQLLSRAQVSWLSKRDVLDILTNWQAYNLPISLMPPDQPGPGSLFLFDRTHLKSFRRDNHVWKSKAGGKTVQETHEKLKIEGGIPALNCYYAHSADGTLQRRCYWKLAGTPNIVLMHYRSPGSGKRTDRGSPPTAATPLTIHGRVPGYLPPPDAMQHAHSDLAGPAALPVPARAPGDTALAKSPQQMLGLEHDAAREHVGSGGASAVPPAAGAVPHVALNTPPADHLAGLSGAGDSLARWPSTDWYGGQGGGMAVPPWHGAVVSDIAYSHLPPQLPSQDHPGMLPPVEHAQPNLPPALTELDTAAGLPGQPPLGVPAVEHAVPPPSAGAPKVEDKPADLPLPPDHHVPPLELKHCAAHVNGAGEADALPAGAHIAGLPASHEGHSPQSQALGQELAGQKRRAEDADLDEGADRRLIPKYRVGVDIYGYQGPCD